MSIWRTQCKPYRWMHAVFCSCEDQSFNLNELRQKGRRLMSCHHSSGSVGVELFWGRLFQDSCLSLSFFLSFSFVHTDESCTTSCHWQLSASPLPSFAPRTASPTPVSFYKIPDQDSDQLTYVGHCTGLNRVCPPPPCASLYSCLPRT